MAASSAKFVVHLKSASALRTELVQVQVRALRHALHDLRQHAFRRGLRAPALRLYFYSIPHPYKKAAS